MTTEMGDCVVWGPGRYRNSDSCQDTKGSESVQTHLRLFSEMSPSSTYIAATAKGTSRSLQPPATNQDRQGTSTMWNLAGITGSLWDERVCQA